MERLWWWEGYGCVFSEELLEASLMSDRANAKWLQDRTPAGQGQASQQRY